MSDVVRSMWEHGHGYIDRGWAVFLLATDNSVDGKKPFGNCERCNPRRGTCRVGESCECLLCHSFYAGTKDHARWDEMVRTRPEGHLAIRTGSASRLLVIDAEASADDGDEETGLDVIDQWEAYTQGQAGSLPPTLTAKTVSGGIHLYYQLSDDTPHISSMVRILPSVDIKCESGLVVGVGSPSGKRHWVNPDVPVAELPRDLLTWLTRQRSRGTGGGGSHSAGYDFNEFARNGCPGGHRDYFINDLLVRLRRQGLTYEQASVKAYDHWQRIAQPPEARTYCAWEHFVYKIDRVWTDPRIKPDDTTHASALLERWEAARATNGIQKIGRVTIVKRGTR